MCTDPLRLCDLPSRGPVGLRASATPEDQFADVLRRAHAAGRADRPLLEADDSLLRDGLTRAFIDPTRFDNLIDLAERLTAPGPALGDIPDTALTEAVTWGLYGLPRETLIACALNPVWLAAMWDALDAAPRYWVVTRAALGPALPPVPPQPAPAPTPSYCHRPGRNDVLLFAPPLAPAPTPSYRRADRRARRGVWVGLAAAALLLGVYLGARLVDSWTADQVLKNALPGEDPPFPPAAQDFKVAPLGQGPSPPPVAPHRALPQSTEIRVRGGPKHVETLIRPWGGGNQTSGGSAVRIPVPGNAYALTVEPGRHPGTRVIKATCPSETPPGPLLGVLLTDAAGAPLPRLPVLFTRKYPGDEWVGRYVVDVEATRQALTSGPGELSIDVLRPEDLVPGDAGAIRDAATQDARYAPWTIPLSGVAGGGGGVPPWSSGRAPRGSAGIIITRPG